MEHDNMFRFVWKIENYSYSWQEVNQFILSPPFAMCSEKGISWCLKLYPRGLASYNGFTSLYLERESTPLGAAFVSVDYELSILRSDGRPEYTAGEKARVFAKRQASGFVNMISRKEIFTTKKSILLPDDTLTVLCRICFENIVLPIQIQAFAKSEIFFHRENFLWHAGEFNYIFPHEPGYFARCVIQNAEMALKLHENCIYVSIRANNDLTRMHRFRIGILDSNGSTSQFLVDEYIFNKERQSITTFLIKRARLLQRRNLYLPEGRLVLNCESIYSKGVYMGQIEGHAYDRIFMSYPLDVGGNSKTITPPVTHPYMRANDYSPMRTDFKNLYQEGIFCDFTVKVESENLQVHKVILCARSPVFKAMLMNNMKENLMNVVEISDLDADTVRRMLKFIYTDTVNDLDWEAAIKLYFAADKYDIAVLKRICSEFLKINLSVTNVGEALTLANMHLDEDLKRVALVFMQRFIKKKKLR